MRFGLFPTRDAPPGPRAGRTMAGAKEAAYNVLADGTQERVQGFCGSLICLVEIAIVVGVFLGLGRLGGWRRRRCCCCWGRLWPRFGGSGHRDKRASASAAGAAGAAGLGWDSQRQQRGSSTCFEQRHRTVQMKAQGQRLGPQHGEPRDARRGVGGSG